jgi:hypothetical protein
MTENETNILCTTKIRNAITQVIYDKGEWNQNWSKTIPFQDTEDK